VRSQVANCRGLIFATPPTPTSLPVVFQGFSAYDTTEVNSGTYALDYSAPENQGLLSWEEWLVESLQHTEQEKGSSGDGLRFMSIVVRKDITDALEEVHDIRAKEWERQRVLLANGGSDRESTINASLVTICL
jgi:hypothetical protein